ncbi:unnamed protein product [Oncorhynchus mykiss]|uniref:Uncharacterized protein n=1 Tax=Oncorhynchus mykiss TaxID=8022 RepID=A0A060VUT8_ONCMY|nr:unnamed protein product [Oncorhynchus mykiss]
MTEYKQCSYFLCKAIKQAKCQYRDKVESQFNGSDTRRSAVNHGLQKENQPRHGHRCLAARQNKQLLCFENNTVPLTRPATKTCGLSFTAANVSKTYKRHLHHPMSQEGQKDHQGQQPPEPLPVHPAIIQKVRSVQVHQSWDRETEKHILSQVHQTVKQPSLTVSGCCQHTDSLSSLRTRSTTISLHSY